MPTKQSKPAKPAPVEATEELEAQLEENTAPETPTKAAAGAQPATGKRAQYREAYAKGTSRTEIAKQFSTSYQNVYAATKDMENNGTGGGGNADGSGGFRPRVFVEVEGADGKTVQMPRSEYIRRQYEAGESRGAIAKELGVAFQIVYAATKNSAKPNVAAAAGDELEEDEDVDTEDILEDEDDGDELEEEEGDEEEEEE